MKILDIEQNKIPTIENTVAFIKKAHEGQYDKAGLDYFHHPISVANRLVDPSNDEYIAALLHDVLEDTPYTEQDLRNMGYNENIINIVKQLSRPAGLSYIEWIRKIASVGNKSVIKIKIADNEDNSDPKRIAQLPIEMQSIIKRYERSLKILRAV